MVRKITLLIAALTLALVVMPHKSHAATSTVGGTSGLNGNGVNKMTAVPFQAGTPTCNSVALNATDPTQIAAADNSRAALYIVNASTQGLATVLRNPDVYITTNTTTNLGSSPAVADLPKINGLLLSACRGNIPGSPGGSGCRIDFGGVTVPKGALYAIAESTGAKVQVCSFAP